MGAQVTSDWRVTSDSNATRSGRLPNSQSFSPCFQEFKIHSCWSRPILLLPLLPGARDSQILIHQQNQMTMTLSWIHVVMSVNYFWLVARRQPHLLDKTKLCLHGWSSWCRSRCCSSACMLDGFWKEPLLGSLNLTYHKKGTSIIEWPDVRSGLTDHRQCLH